jgi:hypothetical protein
LSGHSSSSASVIVPEHVIASRVVPRLAEAMAARTDGLELDCLKVTAVLRVVGSAAYALLPGTGTAAAPHQQQRHLSPMAAMVQARTAACSQQQDQREHPNAGGCSALCCRHISRKRRR